MLALFIMAAIFIIEAPRFLNTLRQRQERIASYVEQNESAQATLERGNRLRRWGYICYFVAALWAVVVVALFGPQRFGVALGIALVLAGLGFALTFYGVYARTAVDFRSISVAKPKISKVKLWITTVLLSVVILSTFVADEFWHIGASNWLFGALALALVVLFAWRWLRGWPNEKNSAP
jgi:hypothetical protein